MSVTTVEAVASRPDPEVRPARQSYPAAYKVKILAELDAAESKSAKGEIMRREGLNSSLISAWRDQRDKGAWRRCEPSARARCRRVDAAQHRRGLRQLGDQRLDRGEVGGVEQPDLEVRALAMQFFPRRKELVQGRVEQADHDREAIHRLKNADEVLPLELEQSVDGLALFGG